MPYRTVSWILYREPTFSVPFARICIVNRINSVPQPNSGSLTEFRTVNRSFQYIRLYNLISYSCTHFAYFIKSLFDSFIHVWLISINLLIFLRMHIHIYYYYYLLIYIYIYIYNVCTYLYMCDNLNLFSILLSVSLWELIWKCDPHV